MKDIYFDTKFGKLYESIEHGRAIVYEYNGLEGCVRYSFILREIPIPFEGVTWNDIITPYGYGGPVIEALFDGYTREELVSAFENEFSSYCEKNRIVSDFVRFHPMAENVRDFGSLYNAVCIRHTLGTNLEFDDPIAEEFSRGSRKTIRRALDKGVSFRVTEAPRDLEVLKSVYYATMDRNNADEYYYFGDEYFDNCLKCFGDSLLLTEAVFEGKTIAAGVSFLSNGAIHVHLSGTLSEYLYLSPAYILKYATALWGKEHGYRLIHYGGGRSNSPDDPLFLFKKRFASKTEFEFYIGKKIWNRKAYEALCECVGVSPDVEFFPAYRSKNR